MFKRLGLEIPQTYAQLLDVCRKAKAAGTSAVVLAAGAPRARRCLILSLVVPIVYAKDKQWTGKLKAGKVTFGGSAGWRRGLQRFVDMNDAGCFQPGAAAVSSGAAAAVLFAQGQGLMSPSASSTRALSPPRARSSATPSTASRAGASPTETTTFVNLLQALSVNAHASARNQAAAQTFIDFLARPKQNELFARATGGLTEYELLKGQIPDFMSSLQKRVRRAEVRGQSRGGLVERGRHPRPAAEPGRADDRTALDRRRPEGDGRGLEARAFVASLDAQTGLRARRGSRRGALAVSLLDDEKMRPVQKISLLDG